MLLCGKLAGVYVALDEETRTSLPNTKKALIESAGILQDPLIAGQAFMSRHQLTGETVRDYAMNLRKLFTEFYLNISYPATEIPDWPIPFHLPLTSVERKADVTNKYYC